MSILKLIVAFKFCIFNYLFLGVIYLASARCITLRELKPDRFFLVLLNRIAVLIR